MKPWKLTKTQRFVLEQLVVRGRVPEPTRRYTLSLRIMEERGLIALSMTGQWSAKSKGIELINQP